MICSICGSSNVGIEYHGKLKTNRVPPLSRTDDDVDIFCCKDCGVLWHNYKLADDFYQSSEYRNIVESTNDEENFYKLHDVNTVKKLNWTGTDIFRNKIVADIGAGAGAFLDYIRGVASKTIAVEPDMHYRNVMENKGHLVFEYTESALVKFSEEVNVATSFDVVEHVTDPQTWINEVYQLLNVGGQFICGTPTDYPLLRKFAKDTFEPFIFQAVHPWIFTEKSLQILFHNAGFKDISIAQHYHYGIGNFVNWLTTGTAKGDIRFDEFSELLNDVFRREMCNQGLGEYMVVKARKAE